MRPKIQKRALLLAISLLGFALVSGALLVTSATWGVRRLAASWNTTPGGIGIPGLTKTYEATLTNRGIVPVRISVCDYVTDAFGYGKSVAYSVERWDESRGKWQFFWGVPRQEFCKAHGLDILPESKVRRVWLWPHESISTDFVAIQAIDGLRLNDRLRFVVKPFDHAAHIMVATPAFMIDERPTDSETSFRIMH